MGSFTATGGKEVGAILGSESSRSGAAIPTSSR
jgi:hypothetical protein